MKAEKLETVRVAVIGKDGVMEYREVPLQAEEPRGGQRGKVVFPFERTSVHSDAWRASKHARFIAKDDGGE